jgi:hypothetical protein
MVTLDDLLHRPTARDVVKNYKVNLGGWTGWRIGGATKCSINGQTVGTVSFGASGQFTTSWGVVCSRNPWGLDRESDPFSWRVLLDGRVLFEAQERFRLTVQWPQWVKYEGRRYYLREQSFWRPYDAALGIRKSRWTWSIAWVDSWQNLDFAVALQCLLANLEYESGPA